MSSCASSGPDASSTNFRNFISERSPPLTPACRSISTPFIFSVASSDIGTGILPETLTEYFSAFESIIGSSITQSFFIWTSPENTSNGTLSTEPLLNDTCMVSATPFSVFPDIFTFAAASPVHVWSQPSRSLAICGG